MLKGSATGNVNIIIYIKDTLNESEKKQIQSSKLIDIIRQLRIPVGRIESIDDNAVAILESDNFVMASVKTTLGRWCKVETFFNVHPRLTPNVGPLAKGSN